MKYFSNLSILFGMLLSPPVFAQVNSVTMDFSGKSAEENKVTLQGAGFGAYPQANVTFGFIPTDNAFDGATDGHGAIITAQPGEGVIVYGQKFTSTNAAVVRCTVRTDQPHASIIIATIGDKPDIFVSSNYPTNEAYFTGQYLRLQTLCSPPSTGFQPLIQIINTSKSAPLTAYLDNFEIYLLDPSRYTSNAFLDGDVTDPPADQISIPSDAESGVVSPSALKIKVGQTRTDIIMEMELIPAGTFTMGGMEYNMNYYPNEFPLHQVKISNAFYMGKYEVTQAQWQAVMNSDSNPSYFQGSFRPVEGVSWDDCMVFIDKLNALNQGVFRLPTEAEWEYACRAGTTDQYYWGSGYEDLYSWNSSNSDSQTHEVGLKAPNSWGLFDTCGNVMEWCQDWYGNYSSDAQIDPINNVVSSYKVLRGGYWLTHKYRCRSAYREYDIPSSRSNRVGFRLVRNL